MPFDFLEPDYIAVFRERALRLQWLRENPDHLPSLRAYYREHPADFIDDWGITYDPRNPEIGLPAVIPFKLFPAQREWVDWFLERWRERENGLSDKSRDMGLSWLAISLACTLCIFHHNIEAGFGSNLEKNVDKKGVMKALLPKARMFMKNIPSEFRPGWDETKHAPFMQITFPWTGSMITGEVGDNIGRGGRNSFYVVDEAAFLEHPLLVDAALSQTTNCRIDISSANGTGNPFHFKRFSLPARQVFTFHWRRDPRKDDDWYEKTKARINNPVIVASEVDIDYSASVEGVLIPALWVQAAIDAHLKLKIKPDGIKLGAMDVADEGQDTCAFAGRQGVLLEHVSEWAGTNSDIFKSVQRSFRLCDELGYTSMHYDAGGLGASVRGDARVINEDRRGKIRVIPFQPAGEIMRPDAKVPGAGDRTNADFFSNYKAQSWWHVRTLFRNTYQAVVEGLSVPEDQVISISSKLPLLVKATQELSQPIFSFNNNKGKMVIEKKPDGTRSPNLADSIMIAFAPKSAALSIYKSILSRI